MEYSHSSEATKAALRKKKSKTKEGSTMNKSNHWNPSLRQTQDSTPQRNCSLQESLGCNQDRSPYGCRTQELDESQSSLSKTTPSIKPIITLWLHTNNVESESENGDTIKSEKEVEQSSPSTERLEHIVGDVLSDGDSSIKEEQHFGVEDEPAPSELC
ncbi:homeobox-leucine zipper protein ATHB-12 [Spatholobus suberectus]|nr:homeobox-leucine zipper protein ATHB-12 [Spatholobus suberectus]